MKSEEDFLQQGGLSFYMQRVTSDPTLRLISKLLTKDFQTADFKMTYLVVD